MKQSIAWGIGVLLLSGFFWVILTNTEHGESEQVPQGREEVVFWHFWGGEDRKVVQDVVDRFNDSQNQYFVRAVAMPGNNLQAKLFLSVAGGDSPDLINQDDPVIPDWASRGIIRPLDDIAPPEEIEAIGDWLLPAAKRLSTFDHQLFGLCNGLDIRALYYNKSLLDQYGLEPPETIEDLDYIAETIAEPGQQLRSNYGYLPDTRRLWAWGYVFGGTFYESESNNVTVDDPAIVAALEWMSRYQQRYGADQIAAFRNGDQSLPGDKFRLLPVESSQMAGRYAVIMDGQWQVRKINAFQKRRRDLGLAVPEFGTCPLPFPNSIKPGVKARKNAGWVNGNFFVFPRNAKNSRGAWEFAKFWIGYQSPESAAKTCAAGGWIPVADQVIQSQEFQEYLKRNPLFQTFVDLARSPNQFPTPMVVGASMFKRSVERASYDAMFTKREPKTLLREADLTVQRQLDRVREKVAQ